MDIKGNSGDKPTYQNNPDEVKRIDAAKKAFIARTTKK